MEQPVDTDSILIDSILIETLFDSSINDCPICYEIKYNRFYGNCIHWWCLDCHSKMHKYYTCPMCREPYKEPPPKSNDVWIGPPTSPINLQEYNSNYVVRRRILRQIINANRNPTSPIIRRNNIRVRRQLLCNCIIS
jgi:hypothetical protein